MSPPLSPADAGVLAQADAVHVQDANGQAFALMRVLIAGMADLADKDEPADSSTVGAWAGMLRWLVATLDDRNDELRDRYLAAGWLQASGHTGAA